MREITKLISTFFYLGFAPVAPGTVASLGALAVYLLVKDSGVLFALVTIAIFILGMAFSGRAEKIFGEKDPGKIVIDEVSGMLVSLLFLPSRAWVIITAFVLFRLFDIIKPPPIRKIEKMHGSFGIMLDDLIAGLYTNIILQILVRISKIW